MAQQFALTLQSFRVVPPDIEDLRTRFRNASGDPVAEITANDIFTLGGTNLWTFLKSTAWTQAQGVAAQNALDNANAWTQQVRAQQSIDSWPIEYKALVLALVDQLNVLRAALPTPLGAITPAQALAAVRTKAGTL